MHFKKLDKLRLWLDFPFVDLFYSLNISIENSVVEKWERKVLRFFFKRLFVTLLYSQNRELEFGFEDFVFAPAILHLSCFLL